MSKTCRIRKMALWAWRCWSLSPMTLSILVFSLMDLETEHYIVTRSVMFSRSAGSSWELAHRLSKGSWTRIRHALVTGIDLHMVHWVQESLRPIGLLISSCCRSKLVSGINLSYNQWTLAIALAAQLLEESLKFASQLPNSPQFSSFATFFLY